MEVKEKGLVWSERRSDGHWYAPGNGGQYQLVPRRDGSGYRAWWLGSGGANVDLGKHGTLAGAMGAAARFDPATGQAAAEARYDMKKWAVFFEGPNGPDVLEVQAENADSAARIASNSLAGAKIRRVRPLGEASGSALECSCAHTHPSSVPSSPCPVHAHEGTHAAEEGKTARVLYEPGAHAAAPMKTLRWHRGKKGGYTATGRMGEYEVVSRKPDRRHGILPVALLTGSGAALHQFDSVSDAKQFAQSYDNVGPFVLRHQGVHENAHGASEEDRARAQPMANVRVPLDIDTSGARVEAKLKVGATPPKGGSTAPALYESAESVRPDPGTWTERLPFVVQVRKNGATISQYGPYPTWGDASNDMRKYGFPHKGESLLFYERGYAMPHAMEGSRKKGDEGAAGNPVGGQTFSRHVVWRESPRGYTGVGAVTGSFYKVDIHGRPNKHPVWTLMKDGIETKSFYYNADDAMLAADKIEAKAGSIPSSAEASSRAMGIFAARVRRIAESACPKRFGRSKVFVSEVWRCEFSDELPLEDFKQILLTAHRERAVVLSRADLTSAMDPKLVRDSEIVMGDPARPLATFHFLSLDDKWGGSVSAQEVPIAGAKDTPLVTLQRDFKKYEACSKAASSIGPIDGPKAVWKLLARTMLRETQEVFVVVPLNIHDKLTTCPVEIARGSHSRVEVDPAIVCQAALAANADSFLVVHQHPGSRPDPSDADIELTHAIDKAANAVGGKAPGTESSLCFHEHYIISNKGVYSVKGKHMWKAP